MPSNRDPREQSSVPRPAWGGSLLAILTIVMIGGMTTWLALRFDALRPRVGDMIVFTPTGGPPDDWQLTVATRAVVGRTEAAGPCVFDLPTLASDGGSLVIESRQDASPPRFRLHWAGRHTAPGAGDCGSAADVTLDRYDLQRLANAAGGFGVKPTVVR